MFGVGSAALVANLICLALLWRFRRENVNMSSTFECSRNDVASNVGVLAAAGLVGLTGPAWPDIIVGGLIAVIFLRSAWRLLGEAWPAWRAAKAPARVLFQSHGNLPAVMAGSCEPFDTPCHACIWLSPASPASPQPTPRR